MNLYDYLIRNLTHVNCLIDKSIIHRTHVKYNACGIFSVKHLYEHLAEKVYHIAT